MRTKIPWLFIVTVTSCDFNQETSELHGHWHVACPCGGSLVTASLPAPGAYSVYLSARHSLQVKSSHLREKGSQCLYVLCIQRTAQVIVLVQAPLPPTPRSSHFIFNIHTASRCEACLSGLANESCFLMECHWNFSPQKETSKYHRNEE